jgi:hypothetical protein
MAVSLSNLRTSRAVLPRNIIFLHSVFISGRGLSKLQGLVRLEGLGKLKKNSFASSGLEPATLCLLYSALTTTLPCAPNVYLHKRLSAYREFIPV